MRVRPALAVALVTLLAAGTSATAIPPAPDSPSPARFSAFTLPIGSAGPSAGPSLAGAPDAGRQDRPPDPLALLGEPGTPPLPSLAARRQPAPKAGIVVKPTPKPRTSTVRAASMTGRTLRGIASWYCNSDGSRAQRSICHNRYPDTSGFDAYAAAGPKLRAALGGGDRWRGRVVTVDGIAVKLVDWCQCYAGESSEKVIDLYYDVFRRTGSSVTIRW